MNEDTCPPLEGEIAALLRDDADKPVPEAAFRRVQTRLASVVPALLEARPHAPNPSTRLARVFGAHPMTTALAFLGVGAAMGAAAHATLIRPVQEMRMVYVDRPIATAQDSRAASGSGELSGGPTLPGESLPLAPASAPNRIESRASAPLAASPAPSSSESSGETLAAERAVLDDARSSLARHDATRASSLLEQYAQAFPHGHLAEECEALEIETRAVAGKLDSARTALTRFRSRYPRSLFLSALESLAGSARPRPKVESAEPPRSVEKAP